MDILTKYILEQQPQQIKAAKIPNPTTDDRMQDKELDNVEKGIEKTQKDSEATAKTMKSMPMTTEIRIDKLTSIILEKNCGEGKTWNSLKNKCMDNPVYDEETNEEIFGVFAGMRNATDPKK